jgi:hypothetical protein
MVVTHGADFVRMLGRQDIRVYPVAGRALANLMISGEVMLSPTIYQSHVDASKALGAPLGWNAPGPVPVTDTAVALAAKAPHPHAAMLLIDFLLSREAQLLYRTRLSFLPQGHEVGRVSGPAEAVSDEPSALCRRVRNVDTPVSGGLREIRAPMNLALADKASSIGIRARPVLPLAWWCAPNGRVPFGWTGRPLLREMSGRTRSFRDRILGSDHLGCELERRRHVRE